MYLDVSQTPTAKPYSDYLVNGVPIWEVKFTGKTEEEAQAFKEEVDRLKKDKGESRGD